jgi:hypothetical protein
MASKRNNTPPANPGAAGGIPPAVPGDAPVQTPASGIDGLVGFAVPTFDAAADEFIAQIETIAEPPVHEVVTVAAATALRDQDFPAYAHLHALDAGLSHLRSLLSQAEKDLPADSPAIAALKRLY